MSIIFSKPSGPPRLQTVVNDQESLLTHIKFYADKVPLGTFFVSIDGLPGTGKSTLSKAIQQAIGRPVVVISTDEYIATERGSAKRKWLTENPASFLRYGYDFQALQGDMTDIQEHPNLTTLTRAQIYDRKSGLILPSHLRLPTEPRVILLEGLGSTHVLNKLKKDTGAQILTIYLPLTPQESLHSAAVRDQSAGTRSYEEALALRLREVTEGLAPAMYRAATSAHIVYDPRSNRQIYMY